MSIQVFPNLCLYAYFGPHVYLNPRVITGSVSWQIFCIVLMVPLRKFHFDSAEMDAIIKPSCKTFKGTTSYLETSGSNQIDRDLDIQQSLLKNEDLIFVPKIGLLSLIHFFKAKEKVSMKDLEILFSNFYQKPSS